MDLPALSPYAEELIDMLPPFMYFDPDTRGVLEGVGAELQRLQDAMDELRDNFFPQTADQFLYLHEQLLGLAVNPPGKTLAQRRTTVLSFYSTLSDRGAGASWEQAMNRMLGTNWSYQEHVPGDSSTPPEYTLRVKIPYANGSAMAYDAQKLIRLITPAHIALEVGYFQGFIDGVSRVGLEPL